MKINSDVWTINIYFIYVVYFNALVVSFFVYSWNLLFGPNYINVYNEYNVNIERTTVIKQ